MKRLKAKGIKVIVFEPELKETDFFNSRVETNLTAFKNNVDIVLANRMNGGTSRYRRKVFTRDLFGVD